jgi:hypothetical protein
VLRDPAQAEGVDNKVQEVPVGRVGGVRAHLRQVQEDDVLGQVAAVGLTHLFIVILWFAGGGAVIDLNIMGELLMQEGRLFHEILSEKFRCNE